MEDEGIYDVCSSSNETVSDIKLLKQRYEQKQAQKPSTKGKALLNHGAVSILPANFNQEQVKNAKKPVIPAKKKDTPARAPTQKIPTNGLLASVTTKERSSSSSSEPPKSPTKIPPKTAPKPRLDRLPNYTQVDIKNKSVKIKDTDTVVGVDGNLYKRLPKPTQGIAPPPEKPVRGANIMLPDYAALPNPEGNHEVSTDYDDDEELYDEVGLPDDTEDGPIIRPISFIPVMTEEDELDGSRAPGANYNDDDQELYDDGECMKKDMEDDDQCGDIYETFDDDEAKDTAISESADL